MTTALDWSSFYNSFTREVDNTGEQFDETVTLWSHPDKWALVDAKAVASGSAAQMANVLEMALQDLFALYAAMGDHVQVDVRKLDAPIRFRKFGRYNNVVT